MQAIERARAAFPTWKRLGIEKRIEILGEGEEWPFDANGNLW